MTPKAYSYIRFSTPEQLKGDSLRRQLELSQKWASDHGLVLDDSLKLRDLGLSAYSGAHRDKGALGAFLRLVDAGRIAPGSVLLVESLDRLSREEITEALQQFLAIIGQGIKIVTLADNNREYTKETVNASVGDLIVGLTIMSRAHEESKMKAFRLKGRRKMERERARNGGEKHGAQCPQWLQFNKATGDYEKIPGRCAVIERIFSMRLAGKSPHLIARELNNTPNIWKPSSSDPRRKGDGWRDSYLRHILTNHAVYGLYQQHTFVDDVGENGRKRKVRVPDGEPIPDYYPVTVSEKVFFQVKALLERNRGGGGQTGKAWNIFQGLTVCGYCQADHLGRKGKMHFIGDGGQVPNGYRYLVCERTRRAAENGCGCKTRVRYDDFQKLVLNYCRGLTEEEIGRILGEGDLKKATERLSIAGEIEAKRAKLNDARNKVSNILDQIGISTSAENRIVLDKYLSQAIAEETRLAGEIPELEGRLNRLSQQSENFRSSIATLGRLHDFLDQTKQGHWTKALGIRLQLRQLLKGLIDRIEVFVEGYPRMTPESLEEAVAEVLQSLSPEDIGAEDWKTFEKAIRSVYADPRHYQLLRIHFTSGSTRTLQAYGDVPLVAEYDAETGLADVLYPHEEEGYGELLTPAEAEAHERRRQQASKLREAGLENLRKRLAQMRQGQKK